MSEEDRKTLKMNSDLSFNALGFLLQKLPWDIILIFKASHFVSIHNKRFGVGSREKFMSFTDSSIEALSKKSTMQFYFLKFQFYIRLALFEYFPYLFRMFYTDKE
jgi:hypothetical protein